MKKSLEILVNILAGGSKSFYAWKFERILQAHGKLCKSTKFYEKIGPNSQK